MDSIKKQLEDLIKQRIKYVQSILSKAGVNKRNTLFFEDVCIVSVLVWANYKIARKIVASLGYDIKFEPGSLLKKNAKNFKSFFPQSPKLSGTDDDVFLYLKLGAPMSHAKDLLTLNSELTNGNRFKKTSKDKAKEEARKLLEKYGDNSGNMQAYYMLVSDYTGLTFSEVKALKNNGDTSSYYHYQSKIEAKQPIKDEIVKRRLAGEKLKVLANEFGVSRVTIRNYVREYEQRLEREQNNVL